MFTLTATWQETNWNYNHLHIFQDKHKKNIKKVMKYFNNNQHPLDNFPESLFLN